MLESKLLVIEHFFVLVLYLLLIFVRTCGILKFEIQSISNLGNLFFSAKGRNFDRVKSAQSFRCRIRFEKRDISNLGNLHFSKEDKYIYKERYRHKNDNI